MDKNLYKGKYRIPSNRWAVWDYGANAAYFITICTANRVCYFGSILGDTMNLSPIGRAARACWHEIPSHFPFVELDAFVVMPNHVHGIIIINKTEAETENTPAMQNKFGPQSRNMASIIRGYKIGVTRAAHKADIPFAWQSRYHDRVIRNTDEVEQIQFYIRENPKTWARDKLYAKP